MHILYLYTDYFQNYDILWALLQEGHKAEVIDTPFMTWQPEQKLLLALEEKLSRNRFDAVLSFGYVPYISSLCDQYKMPYAAWTYDSILHSLYNDTVEHSCNFLFVYDRAEYRYLKEHFHIPHLYHLPLAVNTERVDAIALSPADRKTYSADISFVGGLYQRNAYTDLVPELSEAEQAYFEQAFSYFMGKWEEESIYDWFSREDADYLQNRLPDYFKNTEAMPDRRYFADILLSKPIGSAERIHMLNLLAENHGVRLYRKPSDDVSVLRNVECCDYLNYYDAMYKAFRFSRVNLNITLHGMVSGIPLRCFDVMGSGGFLLSNWQEELTDYFVPDREFVYYRSLEELADKADFYLRHEELRASVAAAGYQAVCREHTYRHRIRTMLNYMKDADNDCGS